MKCAVLNENLVILLVHLSLNYPYKVVAVLQGYFDRFMASFLWKLGIYSDVEFTVRIY